MRNIAQEELVGTDTSKQMGVINRGLNEIFDTLSAMRYPMDNIINRVNEIVPMPKEDIDVMSQVDYEPETVMVKINIITDEVMKIATKLNKVSDHLDNII